MMATSFINVVSLGQCTISANQACVYLSCNVEGEVVVRVCACGGGSELKRMLCMECNVVWI